jgi:hypothetical protein
MSLDIDRLERPRLSGGKLKARCPACAELGADRSCEHLSIQDEGFGPYRCIVDPDGAGGAHSKRIWELAGKRDGPSQGRPLRPPRPAPTPKPAPRIPPLRKLTVGELAAIADLRGWCSFAGLELLSQRGLLWHGEVFDDGTNWPAWVVMDATRRNAQARRLDGLPWHGIGGKKAKTLPGCDASWPIGAREIKDRTLVVLCEGQPDFCAALLVAWWEQYDSPFSVKDIAPICMTGAGNDIHSDALPMFTGKRVRIAVHSDQAGRDAGERWARQLYWAGATLVDGFDFTGLTMRDGKPVKDLADFATVLDSDAPPASRIFAGLVSENQTQEIYASSQKNS